MSPTCSCYIWQEEGGFIFDRKKVGLLHFANERREGLSVLKQLYLKRTSYTCPLVYNITVTAVS